MGVFDNIKKKAAVASEETRKRMEQTVANAGAFAGKVRDSATESLGRLGETVSDASDAVREKAAEHAVNLGNLAKKLPEIITDYTKEFEPGKFWEKIKGWAADMGQEVVFMAVAIYYLIAEKLGFESKDDKKEEQ